MKAKRSRPGLLLGLGALAALCLVVAFLTVLLVASPPLAAIFLALLLTLFFLVLILVAPEPGRQFEQLAYNLLLIFTVFLVLWPRYALLRIPGLFGVSPARIVLALVLLIWFYMVFRSPSFRARLGDLLSSAKPIVYSMVILFVFKLLSLFETVSVYFSLKGVLNELFTAYLLFPITLTLVNSERRVRYFIGVLVLAGVVSALLGVYESRIGHNLFLGYLEIDSDYLAGSMADKMRAGVYRIQSTFYHPLTFSEFLAMLSPLLAMAMLSPPRRLAKGVMALLIMPLILYVIVKSGSRSGVVAFAFSMAVMIAMVLYRKAKTSRDVTASALTGIAVLLFLMLAALVGYAMSDFVVGRTMSEVRSGQSRILMWEMGIAKAVLQPLFGYGQDLGAYALGYQGGVTIDSYYLSVLLESGFVSLAAYCFMLGYTIKRGVAYGVSRRDFGGNLAIAISSAVLAFAAIKVILSLSHNHGILFALMGVLFQVISWRTAGDAAPACRKETPFGLAPIGRYAPRLSRTESP
jgi:hypothetical protein